MLVPDRELFIAARPFTPPPVKFSAFWSWALALAQRRHVSWQRGRLCGRPPLPITPTLLTPTFLPVRAGPVPLAGLPTPPTPRRLLATFTAITCLRMGRPERPLTAFEKTIPPPTTTDVWSRVATAKKMTSVHGSRYSRWSSLGAKLSTSLRDAYLSHRLSTSSTISKCQFRDQDMTPWPRAMRESGLVSERC
jgi:hypothetical protein